jgi:hypothetical protein
VIISSLLPDEKRHAESRIIWAKVLTGETPAVMPYTVLVEVVAARGVRSLALSYRDIGLLDLYVNTGYCLAASICRR